MAIRIVSMTLRRVKIVKDIFGAKIDKYTSAFLHYTIICFEQFATLYYY